MTCREFVEFLMAYLDAELPKDERTVFEEHMSDCPACLDYLDSYRETVALGQQVCWDPEGPVPEEVPEELVRAIVAARASGS
jgi:anti-sigma factor RsiW